MKPWDLFDIVADADYETIGDDLDYQIVEIEGAAALVFQQSVSRRDWINNFDFIKKPYKNQRNHMLVHRGYARVWKEVNDQVMAEFIEAAKNTDKQPFVMGWSFGGAMSVLAAEDFYYRTGVKPMVVTFGAPKVAGDKKTRNYIASCGDFFQYADRNDCVPLMPPMPWFKQINKISVGGKFNLFELFNPVKNHTSYGDKTRYGETK